MLCILIVVTLHPIVTESVNSYMN